MPTEAAELCMTPVTTAPSSTPIRGFLNMTSISWNTGISARGLTDWLIKLMPVMSMEKPMRTWPASRLRPCLQVIISSMPTRARRGEKDSGLSILSQILSPSMPAALNIQAVSVVPILEPIMTPMVWDSSIMPEFTRPTSITVMAEEDCMAMVITAPRARPFHRFEVITLSTDSSLPPTIFSRADDSTFMPYKKKARPPSRVKTEKISID